MPQTYASKTDVPVSRSRDEIERTLSRFGADSFAYSSSKDGQVMIAFELKDYRIVMRMQLPDRKAFLHNSYGNARTESAVEKDWEQASRQRWRTLAAAIKAKLAMIDDGISSVEQEFLAQIVVGRSTIGEQMIPQLREGTLQLDDGATWRELPEGAR